MASEVSICNRALQLLGQTRISTLAENSVAARACSNCYTELRDAELMAHPWLFARQQAQLAASSTSPDHTYDNAFPLPSDCLRVEFPENEPHLDWSIHGQEIYTNWGAPLDITYVAQITDPNTMHPLFRECLAARMAMDMCEEITQSNTKYESANVAYRRTLREARRVNALLRLPQDAADDSWIVVRR
jgi:hypothetical protein